MENKLLPFYKSAIKRLCILGFLTAPLYSSGQASSYVPTIYSGTFTPITGTLLDSSDHIDDVGFSVNIGFSFNFNRSIYTKVGVSANGYILFGSAYPPSTLRNMVNSTLKNGVAGFSRDLRGLKNAELRVATTGSAPNRVFIVQWTHMADYPAMSTTDDYNFQILLHEADNIIEVRYGSMTADNSVSADVGIKDESYQSSAKSIVSGTNTWGSATNVVFSGSSGGPSATIDISFKPASGLTYKWASAVTGLPEQLFPDKISVYPNPCNGSFNIGVDPHCAIRSIGVYNLIGELILNIEPGLTENLYHVNLGNVPDGLYFIKAETENGLLSRKIKVSN